MGEELLPCPFCGRKAEAFQDVAGSREPLVPGHGLTITSMSETYGVRCPSCEIEMVNPWVKLNDAIAAWNTRASTPPVGETSALAEELGQCKAGRQRFEHFDSRKLSVDYLVPEDLFNRILAALRKPAEPVGDEVERVARAIAAASYIDLSVAIGEAGGITNAVAEFGVDAISDDPRYRKWRLPSCRGVILAARAAITALSSTPERGWQPIETAPRGDDPDESNGPPILIWREGWPSGYEGYWYALDQAWYFANLDSEYGGAEYPTHWQPLPPPPTKGSTDE